MKEKTLQEIKDQAAKEYGFETFEVMDNAMCFKNNLFHDLNSPEAWQELNDNIAERYAEQFKPKWIPVEERFPQFTHENVLVCRKNGMVAVGHYRITNKYGREVRDFNILDVTHWQPLPAAPERKEEGV